MYVLSYICMYIYRSESRSDLSLELAILGFLNEQPRTGYDLKKRCFSGPFSAFWTADQAQVYRTLDKLSDAGHVSVRRRRQSGKPDRKVYEITYTGREALDALLGSDTALPVLRDPLLLQLYFGHRLDDDSLVALLRARRDAHKARLEQLREMSDELARDRSIGTRDAVLRHTAFDGAVAQQRALIDWLDDCIQAVLDGALPGSDKGIGQRHLFGS